IRIPLRLNNDLSAAQWVIVKSYGIYSAVPARLGDLKALSRDKCKNPP
ncbi:MAG: hypothetical protein QOJ42_6593, partial [Acidobacteriaceae bacterium]|nr:hypothetical protein [Acidobacteriaceae bacterium]